MRRISFWALCTVSAVALLFGYSTSTAGPNGGALSSASSGVVSSTLSSSGSASTNSAGSDQTAAGSGGTGPATTGSSGSAAAAKTVTGSVAQTQWGPVQVQLEVRNGTISKVSVLQYPSGNGRDQEINSRALPILTQETIDAQGAGIDMVSGATVTSDGYLSSLQSALDRAQL